MANKKYTDISSGTPVGTDVILVADPTTGALKRTTVSALLALVGGGGGGDVTAPTVVSATVPNGAPNTVVVVFSESVTATTAGWSFRRNASNWAVSSVSGSGTTWTFTMATSAASGETIDRSYNASTGNTLDGAGNELGAFTNASVTNSISGSFDSDAAAFFASTGSLAVGSISDSTAKNAVNQLVVDLKAAGLWTNMKALYPFVGGSATTQKFNLKNPADTNGAFRMSWVGSDFTFDQTGVVIGAASLNNSYGNTNFNLASQVSNLNAFAAGFYRRGTGFNSLYSPISTYSAAGSRIILGVIGTDLFVDFWDFSQRLGSISVSDMNGLISLVRTANNDMKLYRGATAAATQTATNTGTLPNLDLFCGATNDNGTPSGWNVANNLALFYMYDGALSPSNMTALSTAVDTFQTALSRNV